MTNHIPNRKSHLRYSLIFLILWIFVLLNLYDQFKESNGLDYLFRAFENGNYRPMLLIVASVILLALFIRSIVLYFRGGNTRGQPTR